MSLSPPAIDVADEPALAPIVQPYLLVLFSVPFHVDGQGRRWLEGLWAKDLIEHTRYLKDLTLVARSTQVPPPAGALAMDEVPGLREVRCVEVPTPTGTLSALATLPALCRVLWRELGRARLVHTAVAAWPLPEAWFVVPMLWWRRRSLYINVESAFWRLVPGERAPWRMRARAALFETLNRACIGRADLSTFTHEGYRSSLLRRDARRGHVVEASWIDDEKLLPRAELAAVVAQRRRVAGRLRLVFAGRITREKGVPLLIEAVAACLQAGADLELDLFGDGPLKADCLALVQRLGVARQVNFRASLPYDQRFFDALRAYDVLVVPSITDEQPRIVFDAYSQALPVIASRTEGLLQCVEDGVTGLMFPAGDGAALQALIHKVIAEPGRLSDLSEACLERARRLTHRSIHRRRWALLVRAFPALTRTTPAAAPANPVAQPAEKPWPP